MSHVFSAKVRAGKKLPGIDLFGEQIQTAALKSKAGRPRVPLRTMIALLYLKHAFNESDEGVVQRWSETPVWQFFGGRTYFDQALPCDSTTLVKLRTLLGEEGVEEFKQTFAREERLLRLKAGRYAHAKQFKRMGRAIKRQRTIVARIARQIVAQAATRKNTGTTEKLYAWYAPEVECIAKGKSRTPYEFGVKVGIAATLRHNLIVAARSFAGKPYDGHTLNEQLEQATILMQETGQKPQTAYVDLGYRGVDADKPDVAIKHRGKFKTLTDKERKLLKRRQAIEPIIGHLKADHRMDRCYLKGQKGDRINAVLCVAGYNVRWLLRMIAKKDVLDSTGQCNTCCQFGAGRYVAQSFAWPGVQFQSDSIKLPLPANPVA